MKIQFTLFTSNNSYKPVSCLLDIPSPDFLKTHTKELKKQGIKKICCQRYWTGADLKKYGYDLYKMKIYKEDSPIKN